MSENSADSKKLYCPIEPRPVTTHEAAVIEWLLDYAAVQDVTAFRTTPAAALKVVGHCGCGCCASLDFQPFSKEILPYRMLADAIAKYPDGQQSGLILWGTGESTIAWLEIHDMDPVADRFPDIADLRRWEDLAQP